MNRSRLASWLLPVLVAGLALALRLWYVTALPGQGRDLIFSDMRAYDYTAWQLVRGQPVSGEPGLNGYHPLSASTFYYVGYTYFLAAVYAVFGHDRAAVRVAQAVVGALTVGVAYLLGRLVFGRRPAFIGAALTAAYLPLVYYAGLLLTETWFTFVQAVSLTLWLRAWVWGPGADERAEVAVDTRRTGTAAGSALAFLAGVAGGLTCLTRPVFVLGVAALAAGGWLVPPAPAPRHTRAALVGAFLFGAALAIAPITVRNYQIHHRFFLISTNASSAFYTGHAAHETDLPPGVPQNDAALADYYRARVLRYLSLHWRDYLAEIPEFFEVIWTDNHFWPSTSCYWTPDEKPPRRQARVDMQAHMKGSPLFARWTYFPDLVRYNDRVVWCLVGLPMGLLAVLFLPRANRRWVVLYLTLIPYLAIPFLASPFSRYRLPAAPLVFLLAGQSLWSCWKCHRGNRG